MKPSDRGGELQQRKRVALRFVGDVAPDAGRKVGELVAQQLHRVGLQKRGDVELRQAGAFEESAGSRPGRPEQPDPASPEPPADEPDDRAGGTVQPVHVVDDDEQRGAPARVPTCSESTPLARRRQVTRPR
jgi:hypothetical protein